MHRTRSLLRLILLNRPMNWCCQHREVMCLRTRCLTMRQQTASSQKLNLWIRH